MPGCLFVIPKDYDGSRNVEPIVLEMDSTEEALLIAEAVERYHQRLCRIALRYLHDVHRVSDLTQAAVARVSKNVKGRGIGQRIDQAAADIARDWRRREAEKAVLHKQRQMDATRTKATAKKEDDYAQLLFMQRLVEAMRSIMDEEEQYVLNLFLDGLNYTEIERIGRWPRSTAKDLIETTARRAAAKITKAKRWINDGQSKSSRGPNIYRTPSLRRTQTRSASGARAGTN